MLLPAVREITCCKTLKVIIIGLFHVRADIVFPSGPHESHRSVFYLQAFFKTIEKKKILQVRLGSVVTYRAKIVFFLSFYNFGPSRTIAPCNILQSRTPQECLCITPALEATNRKEYITDPNCCNGEENYGLENYAGTACGYLPGERMSCYNWPKSENGLGPSPWMRSNYKN